MPGKLIPGEPKTPVYKKSGPFELRSGNKSPLEFKAMGSSPAKQDTAINIFEIPHWVAKEGEEKKVTGIGEGEEAASKKETFQSGKVLEDAPSRE